MAQPRHVWPWLGPDLPGRWLTLLGLLTVGGLQGVSGYLLYPTFISCLQMTAKVLEVSELGSIFLIASASLLLVTGGLALVVSLLPTTLTLILSFAFATASCLEGIKNLPELKYVIFAFASISVLAFLIGFSVAPPDFTASMSGDSTPLREEHKIHLAIWPFWFVVLIAVSSLNAVLSYRILQRR